MHSNQGISPIARMIFPVFFMHSLAEEVDHRLKRAGIGHAWSPKLAATVVAVLLIAERILDKIGEDVISLAISLAMLFPMGWFLWQIQAAANLACDDATGASNRRLSWINWLWIALFGVFWTLLVVGLSLPETA